MLDEPIESSAAPRPRPDSDDPSSESAEREVPSEPFCLVERGDRALAFPAAQCSSLQRLAPISPLPRAPRGVVGLTRFEGRVVPVVDWLSAHGSELDPAALPATAILITADPRGGERGSPTALLLVDALLGVEPIDRTGPGEPAEGEAEIDAADTLAPQAIARARSAEDPGRLALSDRWVRGTAEIVIRSPSGSRPTTVTLVDPSAWLASMRAAAEARP